MKKILFLLLAAIVFALPMAAQNAVYVTMKVTPVNATVTIDGQKQTLSAKGELIVRLPAGEHRYEVAATGYAKRTDSFTLANERMDFQVDLESVMASLSVKCATPGAEIYIDGKWKGFDSWNGLLVPGTYRVEVRHNQYHTLKRTVVLTDNDNQQLEAPALTPRLGSIDVAYMPIDAEVYLDGKLLGKSPAVFPDILIGKHMLVIRSEGFTSNSMDINIEENKTLTIEGSLVEGISVEHISTNITELKSDIEELRGVSAKDKPKGNAYLQTSSAPVEEAPKVYSVVEQPPTFPGGEAALLKYIATHVKYPAIAVEMEVQGVVNLRFIVKEDGAVGEVQVAKSVSESSTLHMDDYATWKIWNPNGNNEQYQQYVRAVEEAHTTACRSCDAEAVRVVKSLPRFIPCKQQGKAVCVWFSLPVRFQLQ